MVEHYVSNKDSVIEVCYNKDIFIDEWIESLIHDNRIVAYDVKSTSDIINILNGFDAANNIRFFTSLINNYQISHCAINNNIYTIGTCHGLRTLEKDVYKRQTYSRGLDSLGYRRSPTW